MIADLLSDCKYPFKIFSTCGYQNSCNKTYISVEKEKKINKKTDLAALSIATASPFLSALK